MYFYISYSHRNRDATALAHSLHDALRAHGHQVFFDAGIPLGANWVNEIDKHLTSCDCFILLLSEDSAHSEMVQGELRSAYQRRKREGSPLVLPVRVRYSGEPDYEFRSLLGRLQFTSWDGPADTNRVLAELLDSASSSSEPLAVPRATVTATTTPRSQANQQPSPALMVRRPASAPGGTVRVGDPYYIERNVDALLTHRAPLTGETILIKAPRQMGKSSLLLRYLQACEDVGRQTALLDLSVFAEPELSDYMTLLNAIYSFLLASFQPAAPTRPQITSQQALSEALGRDILTDLHHSIVIAIDEVDRVMGYSYQQDFFKMLRYWQNKTAQPHSPWEKVGFAFVISTEPYLLIDSPTSSPFNHVSAVELGPFSLAQCLELNARHGSPLTSSELCQLYEVLGGHPYLTHLSLYHLTSITPLAFPDLLDRALKGNDPFSDHLYALLFKISRKPDLRSALSSLIKTGAPPDLDTYFRLHAAGLVRGGNRATHPSNLLYARFFKSVL